MGILKLIVWLLSLFLYAVLTVSIAKDVLLQISPATATIVGIIMGGGCAILAQITTVAYLKTFEE